MYCGYRKPHQFFMYDIKILTNTNKFKSYMWI